MISHKHKFVYLHLPKTAGASIVSALHKHSDVEKFMYGHPCLRDYFHTFGDDVSKYFIFTVSRNPFDRALSAFKYLQKGGNNKFDAKTRDEFDMQNLNFKEFVLKFFHQNLPIHLLPQTQFVGEHLKDIDFIIKFENLQEDFNIVCDKIGIPRQQLPHKNETKLNPKQTDFVTHKKCLRLNRENVSRTKHLPNFFFKSVTLISICIVSSEISI